MHSDKLISEKQISAQRVAHQHIVASWLAIGGLCVAGLAASCTDEGEDDSAPSTSSSGTTTATGPSTTATTTTTSGSSSSSSGTGGQASCLDASVTAADFTIKTNDLCPVAVYSAPELEVPSGGVVPTWGKHGGLLTASIDSTKTGSDVHLERWSVSGTTLAKSETVISDIQEIPADASPGLEAVDVPFGDLTMISWTGADFFTQGGAIFLDATHTADSHLATGVTGIATVGSAASSRIFYTGLSAFDGPTSQMNGLYYADFTNTTFGTSASYEIFGEASGPVVADSDGNVLAINTKFSDNTQDMHGYASAHTGPGVAPVDGVPLFTIDGFGDALAALAPAGSSPGLALYQPTSGAPDYAEQNVIVERYTVAADAVVDGGHEDILQLVTAATNVTLTSDDQGQIWVGVPATGGGSTFYVLARP